MEHSFLSDHSSTPHLRGWFIAALGLVFQLQTAHSQFPISKLSDDFHTPTLHPVSAPTADPFIPLGMGQLELGFDDLKPGIRNLEARFIHCTFDWYPSPDLRPTDYINGFHPLSFSDIEASFGTRVDYTHYRMTFPNDLIQFSRSGNYVVEVYDPAAPESILVSKRFVIFEQLVDVEVSVTNATKIELQMTHQEVDFTILSKEYPLLDAYDALQTVILQNGRWDNALVGLPPQFVKGDEVDFNRAYDNAFPGGNSQRFADLKSRKFVSLGMQRIGDESSHLDYYMEPLERRTYKAFRSREDLNGHFVIANERFDDATGSDYGWVHWVLELDQPLYGVDLFLFGGISHGMYLPSHRFLWNQSAHRYELDLLAKQGYYDFLILARPEGEDHSTASLRNAPGDAFAIEGSHDKTSNVYTVFAYYWDPIGYDRVIGMGFDRRHP